MSGCSRPEPADTPGVSATACPRGETATVTITGVDLTTELGEGADVSAGNDLQPNTDAGEVRTTVTVAAEKNLNLEWLERMTRCESLAYEQGLLPRDELDPLAVEGVDVDVRPGDASYVVDIVAADEDSAKEVRRRSSALMQQADKAWQIGWH